MYSSSIFTFVAFILFLSIHNILSFIYSKRILLFFIQQLFVDGNIISKHNNTVYKICVINLNHKLKHANQYNKIENIWMKSVVKKKIKQIFIDLRWNESDKTYEEDCELFFLTFFFLPKFSAWWFTWMPGIKYQQNCTFILRYTLGNYGAHLFSYNICTFHIWMLHLKRNFNYFVNWNFMSIAMK